VCHFVLEEEYWEPRHIINTKNTTTTKLNNKQSRTYVKLAKTEERRKTRKKKCWCYNDATISRGLACSHAEAISVRGRPTLSPVGA
jgi:hypothetical protein